MVDLLFLIDLPYEKNSSSGKDLPKKPGAGHFWGTLLEGILRPRKAIRLQRERFPSLRWVRADARRMPKFQEASFDVVIEKALMLGPLERGWGKIGVIDEM